MKDDIEQKNKAYYEKNAAAYAKLNAAVEVMLPNYERFLSYIPKGGKILDAGCGPGRDSKYFLDAGYHVAAFDASREMVLIAEEYTGLAVEEKRFQDLHEKDQYDGVWANASLLHIQRGELADVFKRIHQCLKKNSIFFGSFKYGFGEVEIGERSFTMMDEESLIALIHQCSGFDFLYIGINPDSRSVDYPDWLSFIVRKAA